MSLRPGLARAPEGRDRRRSLAPMGRGRALPSLDDARRDAARQAWRQFAHAAGARRHRRRARREASSSWLLVVVIGGAVLAWLAHEASESQTEASHEPTAVAEVVADHPPREDERPTTGEKPSSSPISALWAGNHEEPEVGDPPEGSAATEDEPSEPRANPRLAPRTPAPRTSDGWSGPKDPRAAPPGTSDANADALRKLPVARADKPPVGGVGVLGIHIDRIEVGSIYDAGKCSGHETGFSASRSDRVSACFRVVHPRTTQQVNVLWSRNGEVVRRTKMTIPSAHAYRTRAFIVLRDGDAGRWTVRVLSSDDVELARARFDVGS